jgi:hypothetical protein
VEYGPNALGLVLRRRQRGLALELERTRRATVHPIFTIREQNYHELIVLSNVPQLELSRLISLTPRIVFDELVVIFQMRRLS